MNKLICRRLLTLFLLGCIKTSTASWVEHASDPGPRVAAVGESRFDQLFRHGDAYRLPYPFDNLITELESRIDNDNRSGVRQTFVPMGRSLQRDTAAPDYFRYPRRVIALEGEPRQIDGEFDGVLEYRLFIAHQPTSQTLEVISYNDAAGRFEFQVVENYSGDGEPRVRAGNRAMCLSCHQNAAPIFSRTPWSETSFNVEVSKRLVEALPQRFNSLVDVISLDAGVIDMLAERANYLSAAQLLWRRGCISARCRAAMLRAVLQYRLSGKSSFDSDSPIYRKHYRLEIERNWQRTWPRGLRLANSRIPDRNPFRQATDGVFDPLQARPAHATWYEADAVLARGIIYRLAGFFTDADIRQLDRFLVENAARRPAPERVYQARCKTPPGDKQQTLLICGEDIRQMPYAEIHLADQDSLLPARVAQLRIPGDVNIMQPDLLQTRAQDRELNLALGYAETGLSLRLADGDRVESLRLGHDASGTYRLQIRVSEEFALVDAALARLIERHNINGESGLGDSPFRRALILPALMRELGMPASAWPAAKPVKPAIDPDQGVPLPARLALLNAYCGHCHAGEGNFPPAFLRGDSLARITQCAPRMLARIDAWRKSQPARPAPMPPPASIGLSGVDAAAWPQSDHFNSLMSVLESLLERGDKHFEWRDRDYAKLPRCS